MTTVAGGTNKRGAAAEAPVTVPRSFHELLEDDLPRRLRAGRERLGISVRELARRLDISPSAISQVETGRARPSVATLYALVTALEMSLDELFDHGARPATAAPADIVVRPAARHQLDLQTGVRWERLTADSDPNVDFLSVVYEPGGDSSPNGTLLRHAGREYGLVMSGRLLVTVGFETHELGPGDSISFDSTTPHRLVNPGSETTTAVWVVVGRRTRDGHQP